MKTETKKNKKEKSEKIKEKISLRDYHKSRFLAWVSIFVTNSLLAVSGNYNALWIDIVAVIMTVITCILTIIWINNSIAKEIEKEDELAKDNITKAHASISGIFMTILAVTMLISIFWKGDHTIKINHGFITNVWLTFYSMYLFLESGLFLHYEGKVDAGCDED